MFWGKKAVEPKVVIEKLGPINIELLPSGEVRLLNDWAVRVYIPKHSIHKVFKLPHGFKSDFSSFPVIFSWIVDWRRVALAGLVHDYLYSKVYYEIVQDHLTRAEKDIIWREIAKAGKHSANWLQAGVSWLGLVVGGASREYRGESDG